ncbi:MAG: tetratricopeptide repeat protein, partial [Gallionella sp.]
QIQPDYAEVHCVLGVALKELGNIDDAIACFQAALKIDPRLVEVHLNLGSLLLSQGRYLEAWPEYEVRYDPGYSGRQSFPPNLPFPRWRGESLAGKSLVIWPEQGFGDEIQFARYFPLLKAKELSRLTLVSKPPLKDLLENVAGIDAVVLPAEAPSLPHHDYWVFPMSLPLHFSTTVETIPIKMPYLHAPPQRLERWRNRLPKGGLKVGLVWKGNTAPNPHRSLPGLATLAPLWSAAEVTFISLQKGPGEDEAATPPAGQPIIDLGSDIADFADTAAIVDQLDLVICIDTAIAHLVGALNKPCWVLLPFIGVDWRWFQKRTDSPWYPGAMRLFRQTEPGDWSETISEVSRALGNWVDQHKNTI